MIEETIFQALSPITQGRVFPLIAPMGTPSPYIVYSAVSNNRGDVLCGTAEQKTSIQIDVYDKSLFLAKKLLSEISENISFLDPFQITELQGYESDTELYRATLDFLIIQ